MTTRLLSCFVVVHGLALAAPFPFRTHIFWEEFDGMITSYSSRSKSYRWITLCDGAIMYALYRTVKYRTGQSERFTVVEGQAGRV